jgi:probable phosphoglycerate mutase
MQGQQDSPLTDLGIRQAKALGRYLQNQKIDIIYSSSSLRAIHTAEWVRGGKNIKIIKADDLREMSLGSWEGLLFTEVEKKYPEQFTNFWHHPEKYISYGGENFFDLKNRLVKRFEKIIKDHPQQNILIVTHGIVLRTLFAWFNDLPENEIAGSPYPQSTGLSEVARTESGWYIRKWNETGHYDFIDHV